MAEAIVNTIIVLESLSEKERKTGRELYDDTIKRYCEFHKKEIDHSIVEIANKEQFIIQLRNIISKAHILKLGILIHIEAHGLTNKNGLSLADDSELLWDDLKPLLIELNVLTNNQLYITMATCYGRFLHETIDIKMQAPFSGFVSASQTVLGQEIIEDYSPFFEELIKTGDCFKACKVWDEKKTSFIYIDVETLFDGFLNDWLKNMKENPGFRAEFFKEAKSDYDKVKEDWFPKFEDMPFNALLNLAKSTFILKYRKVFLFSKGRK